MLFVTLPTTLAKRGGLLRDLGLGWHFFRTTPWIWTGTVVYALVNTIQMGAWQVLGPVIAHDTFGASGWGAVLSVRAGGLLLMSAVMTKVPVGRTLLSGMVWLATASAPLIVLGLGGGVPLLAAAAFVGGLGAACSGIIWDTARHTHIPGDLMARVSSYDDFGSFAGIPVGQLGVVPIAAAIGSRTTVLWGGLLYLLVPLVPLLLPSVRRLGAERAACAPGQPQAAARPRAGSRMRP